MRSKIALLLAALAIGLAAQPAEAGWKWKKLRWEPKPGQEFRSPYAHDRGHHYGYRNGYGYGAPSYGYGPRPYGYGYGNPSGFGRTPGWGPGW